METMSWAARSGMPASFVSSVSPGGWVLYFRISAPLSTTFSAPRVRGGLHAVKHSDPIRVRPVLGRKGVSAVTLGGGEGGTRVDSDMEILVRGRRRQAKDTCPCFQASN